MPVRKQPDGLVPAPDESLTVSPVDANQAGSESEQPLVFHAPRRKVIGMSVGVGLGLSGFGASAAKPPRSQRPQPGDLIVFRFGDKAGQAVKPDDVPEGAELLQVISKDPESGVLRDGSRLNGINLVRVEAEAVSDDTKPFVTGGIIAYSSVCTHQGCDLTQWVPETTTFKCYCHYSEFDATQLGQPNHGPAKRRLAVLALSLNQNNEFIVAAHFKGKVGFKK